jgi:hypothetical protein
MCRMWHHPKPSIFNVSHFRYSRWKLQNTKLSCITDWSNYCMRYVYLQKDWDVSNIEKTQLSKLTTCRNLFLQVINYGNKMPSPYPHLFTIFRSREKWKLGEVQNMRWSLRLGFGDRWRYNLYICLVCRLQCLRSKPHHRIMFISSRAQTRKYKKFVPRFNVIIVSYNFLYECAESAFCLLLVPAEFCDNPDNLCLL